MEHTAACYAKWADEVLKLSYSSTGQSRMENLAEAQIYATLAVAAATLEVAEGPVITQEEPKLFPNMTSEEIKAAIRSGKSTHAPDHFSCCLKCGIVPGLPRHTELECPSR